jgi:hypothetical protein
MPFIEDLNIENITCPFCKTEKVIGFFQDKRRDYLRCQVCSLVFVPHWQFVSSEEEKSRYDLHQNSPQDQGYRSFLNRIFIPMQKCLAPESCGLDFGSGPQPTLSVMFEEAGHGMTIFDYFYEKSPSVFKRQYDFITATEVVEHLHNPKEELERLWACLRPGGILGLMTKLAPDDNAFSCWHYKNDLTHVCFFSQATFQWLALQWDTDMTFADTDVVLFHKRDS